MTESWQVIEELSRTARYGALADGTVPRRSVRVRHQGGTAVLQESPGDAAALAGEARLLSTLHGRGLPVPQVLAQGEEWLLREDLPGHSPGGLFAADCTREQLTAVFTLLARLHAVPVSAITPAVEAQDRWAAVLEPEHPVHGVLRREAIRDLSHPYAFASPPVLCHGDFHPGNVLCEGGHVTGIVDWDYAQVSHAEFDLAYALLTFSCPRADGRLNLETWHSALQIYMSERPLDFRLLDFMVNVAVLCLHDWCAALPAAHPQRADWLAHCVSLIKTRPWEPWHGTTPGSEPGA